MEGTTLTIAVKASPSDGDLFAQILQQTLQVGQVVDVGDEEGVHGVHVSHIGLQSGEGFLAEEAIRKFEMSACLHTMVVNLLVSHLHKVLGGQSRRFGLGGLSGSLRTRLRFRRLCDGTLGFLLLVLLRLLMLLELGLAMELFAIEWNPRSTTER